MTPENRTAFLAHALGTMPFEACAVLIIENGSETLVFCRNKAPEKDLFIMEPTDYAKAADRGEVVGIVHSHVFQSNQPSQADRVACSASGIAWHICSVPLGSWFSFKPEDFKAPLIGREFTHGVLDCYSLIRDYYAEVLQIEIPDFERDFEWWDAGQNLYVENFQKAGFYEVKDGLKNPAKHDILLMQLRSRVINHGAVYLGDDWMLHHLNKRLSSRQVWDGYYKKCTVKVVRHENNPALR